ncbi:hypothetical protein [Denitrificimonas caeni]|uniref:hypothetical protein n=1 Tax=Denitrificimonas caeni TaxID=521720 RepID=UPI0019661B15|nr:hypothetical protein [Denitrificimonas caeni]
MLTGYTKQLSFDDGQKGIRANVSALGAVETSMIKEIFVEGAAEVLEMQALLPAPYFVIARKKKHYWQVQERIFDYQGSYRKAYER